MKLYVLALALGAVSGWTLGQLGDPMLVFGYGAGVLTGGATVAWLVRTDEG